MGMIGRLSAVSFTSIPTCVGFFVYRHLGRSHNPEVAGSNPAPATMKTRLIDGFFVYERYNYNLSSCP